MLLVLLCLFPVRSFTKELPKELRDPVLFCDGCYATVTEVSSSLSKSRGNGLPLKSRIDSALDGVCSTDTLRAYKFSPPTQVKTCKAILSQFRAEFVNILTDEVRGGKEVVNNNIFTRFCEETLGACTSREVPTLQQKREMEEKKQQKKSSKSKKKNKKDKNQANKDEL